MTDLSAISALSSGPSSDLFNRSHGFGRAGIAIVGSCSRRPLEQALLFLSGEASFLITLQTQEFLFDSMERRLSAMQSTTFVHHALYVPKLLLAVDISISRRPNLVDAGTDVLANSKL